MKWVNVSGKYFFSFSGVENRILLFLSVDDSVFLIYTRNEMNNHKTSENFSFLSWERKLKYLFFQQNNTSFEIFLIHDIFLDPAVAKWNCYLKNLFRFFRKNLHPQNFNVCSQSNFPSSCSLVNLPFMEHNSYWFQPIFFNLIKNLIKKEISKIIFRFHNS